jgi:hypothetical protein
MRRQRNLSPFCICINSFEVVMVNLAKIYITGIDRTRVEKIKKEIANYLKTCLTPDELPKVSVKINISN